MSIAPRSDTTPSIRWEPRRAPRRPTARDVRALWLVCDPSDEVDRLSYLALDAIELLNTYRDGERVALEIIRKRDAKIATLEHRNRELRDALRRARTPARQRAA